MNDYLIYPVKWGRAEDVAATVEPLFQARYIICTTIKLSILLFEKS